MGIAHALRGSKFGTIDQIIGAQISQHGNLGVEQSHVDVLTNARSLSMANRRQNGHGGIHASEQIGNSNTHFLRTATNNVTFTGDAHQAAHGLNRKVIPGSFAVRAGLTITRDAAINQGGVDGLEACVVQAIAGHVPHFEVLDKHLAF